jgi:hypothetical protein
MSKKSTLKEHESAMSTRFGGARARNSNSKYQLQKRVRYAVADSMRVSSFKPSPIAHAMTARQLAIAAKFIMHSYNLHETEAFLEVSLDTAIKLMAAAVQRCRLRCEEYRRQGIDPQIKVGIMPAIEYCAAVYKEYKLFRGKVTLP